MLTDITADIDFNLLFSSDFNLEEDDTDSVYSDEELKVINKHKEKYLNATSPSQRKSIAQLEMFPDLFNYWKENGIIYDKKDTRIKSNVKFVIFISVIMFNFFIQQGLLAWLRNTWRQKKPIPLAKGKQYRLGDILWWLKPNDVLNEISNIMGMDNVDTHTPGWFKFRMAATQNILNTMTENDKDWLRMKGEELAKNGVPEQMKRK